MAIRKYARRVVRKVGNAVKRRYFKGKGYGKPKITQMVKDVAYLKSLVNTEKKSFTQFSASQVVGQVNGNSSGHYLLDLTPNIGQGTGFQQRIGNSVKWCSAHLQMFFQNQSAGVKPVRLDIHIVKVIGEPFSTMSNVMGRYIANNPFVSDQVVYDTYSSRETDYFKNFRIIRRKTITINPSFSGERVVRDINLGFKLKNHHIKWNADTATIAEGQIFLLITASNGNSSSVTANTSASGGVPTQSVSTGVEYKYNFTHYFIDN